MEVVRESDVIDLSLEDLALLRVDHESLVCTPKPSLPSYEDFLQWNATQFFEGDLSQNDVEGHPEVQRSWREVKYDLDQIFALSGSDSQSEVGSRCLSDVKELQLREVQRHVDSLWQIVGKLDEQLEEAERQNRTPTEALNDTKQLLQDERQKKMGGRLHFITAVMFYRAK